MASGTPSPGMVDFRTETTLDPAPGEMKLTLDASHEGAMYLQSTASRTEWIWRSQHVEGVALPQPFACTLPGGRR